MASNAGPSLPSAKEGLHAARVLQVVEGYLKSGISSSARRYRFFKIDNVFFFSPTPRQMHFLEGIKPQTLIQAKHPLVSLVGANLNLLSPQIGRGLA
jgi:hypothetical protein